MDTAVNMDETTVENPFTEVSILEAEPRAADERLAEARTLYKKACADLADAKEQAQVLKQELDHVQSTNEWLRRELDLAYAKIETVELIFGGNKCGG